MEFLKQFAKRYRDEVKNNKITFAVYIVLRVFVVLAMVLSVLNKNYENVFFCGLTLILFLLPAFVEKNFGIDLPGALEIVILLFIFAAEILGEMGSYYTKYPFWDTILHTVNGFLCAAIGFALTDILNRNSRITFNLSPLFLAIVAFCFSMTIGVLWEFFEFFCDSVLGTDMQKDFVVNTINSTLLGSSTTDIFVMNDITAASVNGQDLPISGYLDIGLYDTMKDLLVNFVGAVVFSIIGYFYVKSRGKGKIANLFIPRIKKSEITKTEGNCIEEG